MTSPCALSAPFSTCRTTETEAAVVTHRPTPAGLCSVPAGADHRQMIAYRLTPAATARHSDGSNICAASVYPIGVSELGGWAAPLQPDRLARMGHMPDMRQRGPQPAPEPPKIRLAPGLADQTLRELAPLLAEEGIDVDNIDVPDMETEVPRGSRTTTR